MTTRVFAVAATGDEGDLAALQWAAEEARYGDSIHAMHPYSLLELRECSWRPAIAANDERRSDARRFVAMSVRAVHQANREVVADGSAVVGRALPVLADVSEIADVVVISDQARTDGTRI